VLSPLTEWTVELRTTIDPPAGENRLLRHQVASTSPDDGAARQARAGEALLEGARQDGRRKDLGSQLLAQDPRTLAIALPRCTKQFGA